MALQALEKALRVAEQQIVLVAKVCVEGGAAHAGTIEQALYGDRVELLRQHRFDQRAAGRDPGALDSAILATFPNSRTSFVHDRNLWGCGASLAQAIGDSRGGSMKRDAVSGAALIVGTVSGLVTMALHPSGHQLMAD